MLSPWGYCYYYYYYYPSGVLILTSLQQAVRYWKSLSPHSWWLGAVGVQNGRRLHDNLRGERNSTSTKGRSRWKSSSENYLLIAEVKFRVRDSKTIFHENYLWWMSNCVFQSTNSKCNVRPHQAASAQSIWTISVLPMEISPVNIGEWNWSTKECLEDEENKDCLFCPHKSMKNVDNSENYEGSKDEKRLGHYVFVLAAGSRYSSNYYQ